MRRPLLLAGLLLALPALAVVRPLPTLPQLRIMGAPPEEPPVCIVFQGEVYCRVQVAP